MLRVRNWPSLLSCSRIVPPITTILHTPVSKQLSHNGETRGNLSWSVHLFYSDPSYRCYLNKFYCEMHRNKLFDPFSIEIDSSCFYDSCFLLLLLLVLSREDESDNRLDGSNLTLKFSSILADISLKIPWSGVNTIGNSKHYETRMT